MVPEEEKASRKAICAANLRRGRAGLKLHFENICRHSC